MEGVFPVTGDEDVVIGDGVGEEPLGGFGGGLEPYLGAAEVRGILVGGEGDVLGEEAGEIAADLDEGIRTFREFSVDGDTYAGLEMGGEGVTGGHREGEGAVGHEDLAAVGIDAGGVGLEAGTSRETLTEEHCDEGGDITFTGGGDAFVVETGEGDTTGVADGGEEVETTEGDGVEVIVGYDFLETFVYALGAFETALDFSEGGDFGDGNVNDVDAETVVKDVGGIGGGDEPVGGGAYYADGDPL